MNRQPMPRLPDPGRGTAPHARLGRVILIGCIAVIGLTFIAVSLTLAYERGHVDGQLQEAEGSLDVIRGLLDGCTLRPTP